MKIWIALIVASLAVGAYAQCSCETMKWATCDGSPCTCHLMTGNGTKQVLDCTKLIPKCFLMQAEMYRARKGLSTRGIGGKPDETAFVDNDGIYDPDCENDGTFKAKQCNNTDTCWCVNSAGVRRTDKGDKDLKCEELVMTYWVRLELKHKPTSGNVDVYDPEARLMVVDVKQPRGMRKSELTHMAYYMEKDIKALPLLRSQDPFTPTVGGQKLEFENILVYYVDEKAPTFTMKNLSGGIIAVIVVVVLAVVAGLLVLVSFQIKTRQGKYNKAQQRELDNM
uniref:Thyroglobulin type-1 domain-containing protein n=1 Tax=Periophthalmus magnuspinnatus TaxID=409849 RepID=A0A3B4B278_9GOBI